MIVRNMTDIPEEVRQYLAEIGRRGGKAVFKKPRGLANLPPEKRRELARKAVRARWEKERAKKNRNRG